MRCANLVDLEVFVTIRSRLNVLKSLVLLQTIDRFHVTDPKVIYLVRVEEAVRKDKTILKKGIDLFLVESQLFTLGIRFEVSENEE